MRKLFSTVCLISTVVLTVSAAEAKRSPYPSKQVVVRTLKGQLSDSHTTIRVFTVAFRRVVHFKPPTPDYPTGTAYAVHIRYDELHHTTGYTNFKPHPVTEVAHYRANYLLTRTVSGNWVLRIQGYNCTSPDNICPGPTGGDGGA